MIEGELSDDVREALLSALSASDFLTSDEQVLDHLMRVGLAAAGRLEDRGEDLDDLGDALDVIETYVDRWIAEQRSRKGPDDGEA